VSDTTEVIASEPVEPATPSRRARRGRRLLLAIVIVLLLALIGISAVLVNLVIPKGDIATEEETGGLVWVKSIYGWGDTPETQFVAPRELTISNGGTIWVTDAGYMRALAFNPQGDFVESVGETTPEDPLISIGPVSVGPEAAVYVGDQNMDRVRVFGSDGAEIGFFSIPNPIDIDYNGEMMAIGSDAGFAIVDPNNGEPLKVVGTRGQGEDQFDTVNGVAVGPDNTVYVVDAYNNRLGAYDAEGSRLWSVATGAPGNQVDVTGANAVAASTLTSAPAALGLPADVCLDGNGRIVVLDGFDFSIAVFEPDTGEFIAKYGAFGSAEGHFRYPTSIAYDAQRDWFAVADNGNKRVQIVRIPGSGSQGVVAGARRALAGPLRACVAPLLLLLIGLILYVVSRIRKRTRDRRAVVAADQVTVPLEGSVAAHAPESL